MSKLVPLYDSGYYGIPALLDALTAAGSPRLNDGWRDYDGQKRAYDDGLPAWNPDDPDAPLEHLRGIAADIAAPDPARLKRAGLIMPYPWETWHWALPNWRAYPIIPSLTVATATAPPIPKKEDTDMPGIRVHHQRFTNGDQAYVVETETGFFIPDKDHLAALVKAYNIDLSKLPLLNEYDWNAVQSAKEFSNRVFPK